MPAEFDYEALEVQVADDGTVTALNRPKRIGVTAELLASSDHIDADPAGCLVIAGLRYIPLRFIDHGRVILCLLAKDGDIDDR